MRIGVSFHSCPHSVSEDNDVLFAVEQVEVAVYAAAGEEIVDATELVTRETIRQTDIEPQWMRLYN